MSEINWGSVADWVSGVGSLSAVVAALYLSRTAGSVKLHGLMGPRVVVERGRENVELLSIFVTNTGLRPTVIRSIGLRFGLLGKRYAILKLQKDEYMDQMPKPLGDGEQAHWGIALDKERTWIDDLFRKEFIRNWLDVESMVVQVHTTNGGTVSFRPEKAFRKMIHARRRERGKTGNQSPTPGPSL